METDRSETCIGVAACDGEEWFAGEESGYVDRFSRDGEEGHFGAVLEDVVLA